MSIIIFYEKDLSETMCIFSFFIDAYTRSEVKNSLVLIKRFREYHDDIPILLI